MAVELTADIPQHVADYLDLICASGIGKTREELAAHLIEQGVWRICGEKMGFAKPPADASTTPQSNGR